MNLLEPGRTFTVPGVVFLVAVGAFGLGLLPILMLVDAYRSLMPATANCTLVSLLAL